MAKKDFPENKYIISEMMSLPFEDKTF